MSKPGTLKVRVYTSEAQIPVTDATVVVTQQAPSGKYELLTVQSTDSSGEIQPVRIDIPLGERGEHSFVLCNVWAEHPGYVMLMVEGVQVFSGIDTIQEMALTPLSRGQSSLTRKKVRELPIQDL